MALMLIAIGVEITSHTVSFRSLVTSLSANVHVLGQGFGDSPGLEIGETGPVGFFAGTLLRASSAFLFFSSEDWLDCVIFLFL